MKKFVPHITIWSIDICDRKTGVIIHQQFFLFYKRAKRCYDKHLERLNTDYFEVWLGEEPLLLW